MKEFSIKLICIFTLKMQSYPQIILSKRNPEQSKFIFFSVHQEWQLGRKRRSITDNKGIYLERELSVYKINEKAEELGLETSRYQGMP